MMDELDKLVQIIPQPAYFFDMASRRLVAANEAFRQLMGYSNAELLQMTLDAFRPGEDVPKLEKALASSPPQGSVEWRYVTKDGRQLHVQLTYRNNSWIDPLGVRREMRMVVISQANEEPVRTAGELFG